MAKDGGYGRRVPRHLGEVVSVLAANSALDHRTRQSLISAIKSFAAIVRAPPDDLPTTCPELRERIRLAKPALAGVTAKTWGNVRSLLAKAIAQGGCDIELQRRLDPIGTNWMELLDTIKIHHQRIPFLRFARWCSRQDINPATIDDSTIKAFFDHLVNRTLVTDPVNVVRNLVRIWNRRRATTAHWPDRPLSPFRNRLPYVLAVEVFQNPFQTEYKAFKERLSRHDLFSALGPKKPLRPATVKARLFSLRQAASALVLSGYHVNDLVGLATLVHPAAARKILEFFWNRAGHKATSQTNAIGETLVMIAKYFVGVSPEELAELKHYAAVVTHHQTGMTSKNADRLRAFDDPTFVAKFLALPEQLMREAGRTRNINPRKAKALATAAMALRFLQSAPIRIGNLCSLNLNRHFRYAPGRERIPNLLVIPGDEVKNSQDIELPLPEEFSRVFHSYEKDFRRLMIEDSGGWLFPSVEGHRSEVSLFHLITTTAKRELEIAINPHLMRHIAAKLFLDRNPGAYEIVRMLLGHKTVQTCLTYYTGLEARAAIEHYHEVVLRPGEPRRLVPHSGSRPHGGAPR